MSGFPTFLCSFVYAHNTEGGRKELWRDLCAHRDSGLFQGKPWIICGDFNEVLNVEEHSKILPAHSMTGMREFQKMARYCQLSDLVYQGPKFTWCNRQEGDLISKKLDRWLVNQTWLGLFGESYSVFESGGCSDHLRGRLMLSRVVVKEKKPFKFVNILAKEPDFLPLIKQEWDRHSPLYVSTSACHRFSKYLKELKGPLRGLGKSHIHDLTKRKDAAYIRMCTAQENVLRSSSADALREEVESVAHWEKLASIEEGFLKQRSKLHWLQVGDKNNSYFYQSLAQRKQRNTISELTKADGSILFEHELIKEEAVNHFQTFLNVEPADYIRCTMEELEELVPYRCSPVTSSTLLAEVSDEEIRSTLFSMPNNKAPGPDGYTAEFFKSSWSVLGGDFLIAVRSFFTNGFLPKGINSTILALIPKKEIATTIKDYRPISCCNVFYKVISRILASRLKAILPDIISKNQSAFVQHRLLMENVLLASEVMKDYHSHSISPRCAFMLDISKAFDSVQWSFLLDILRVMRFPEGFIKWIEICITTASFSVQVNGTLAGYFGSKRGLRQGCSLSPYLFVICMEVLSRLLDKSADSGVIGYHPKCAEIKLTHLCFADDLMVFVDGSHQSVEGLLLQLQRFGVMSGLKINLDKSTMFVAGMDDTDRLHFCSAYSFSVGSLPVRYLGLPLLSKRMSVADYKPLVERIRTRLSSWTGRFLSYAGRVQLISSVIYGLVNFWQSAFCLPSGCLAEIDSLCSAFIWDGPGLDTSKAKVSWINMCLPKSEGGLGFRPFKEGNRVSCLKLVWRILSRQKSLWVDWIYANALKDYSFWTVQPSPLHSWMFKKLFKLRELVKNLHKVEPKSGITTSFWYDEWSDFGRLIDLVGAGGVIDFGIQIGETLDSVLLRRRGRRRRHRIDFYNLIEDKLEELQTRYHIIHAEKDVHLWRSGADSFLPTFNTRKTWRWLREAKPVVHWSRLVWFSVATPKYSFIQWLCFHDRLPTVDHIRCWNPSVPGHCALCNQSNETRDHLFFDCVFSKQIWFHMLGRLFGDDFTYRWLDIPEMIRMKGLPRDQKNIVLYAFQASIYAIWFERNRRRHGHQLRSHEELVVLLRRMVTNRISSYLRYGDGGARGSLQFWFSLF